MRKTEIMQKTAEIVKKLSPEQRNEIYEANQSDFPKHILAGAGIGFFEYIKDIRNRKLQGIVENRLTDNGLSLLTVLGKETYKSILQSDDSNLVREFIDFANQSNDWQQELLDFCHDEKLAGTYKSKVAVRGLLELLKRKDNNLKYEDMLEVLSEEDLEMFVSTTKNYNLKPEFLWLFSTIAASENAKGLIQRFSGLDDKDKKKLALLGSPSLELCEKEFKPENFIPWDDFKYTVLTSLRGEAKDYVLNLLLNPENREKIRWEWGIGTKGFLENPELTEDDLLKFINSTKDSNENTEVRWCQSSINEFFRRPDIKDAAKLVHVLKIALEQDVSYNKEKFWGKALTLNVEELARAFKAEGIDPLDIDWRSLGGSNIFDPTAQINNIGSKASKLRLVSKRIRNVLKLEEALNTGESGLLKNDFFIRRMYTVGTCLDKLEGLSLNKDQLLYAIRDGNMVGGTRIRETIDALKLVDAGFYKKEITRHSWALVEGADILKTTSSVGLKSRYAVQGIGLDKCAKNKATASIALAAGYEPEAAIHTLTKNDEQNNIQVISSIASSGGNYNLVFDSKLVENSKFWPTSNGFAKRWQLEQNDTSWRLSLIKSGEAEVLDAFCEKDKDFFASTSKWYMEKFFEALVMSDNVDIAKAKDLIERLPDDILPNKSSLLNCLSYESTLLAKIAGYAISHGVIEASDIFRDTGSQEIDENDRDR